MSCNGIKTLADLKLDEQRAGKTLPPVQALPESPLQAVKTENVVKDALAKGEWYEEQDGLDRLLLTTREGDIQADQFDPEVELHLARGVLKHFRHALTTQEGQRLLAVTEGVKARWIADGMAEKNRISARLIFTTQARDVGAGSGGPGGCKVFWQPVTAQDCPAHTRSFGVDPIYTLVHEVHHAYGFDSEFDKLSDALALDYHLSLGNTLNPQAVEWELTTYLFHAVRRASRGHADWTRQARAVVAYLYTRHPERMRLALQQTFGDWQAVEARVQGWIKKL